MPQDPHLCDVSIDQPPQPLSHHCRVSHHPSGAIPQSIHHLLVQQSSIEEVEQHPHIIVDTICGEDLSPCFQTMLGNNRHAKDLVI